MGVGGVMALKVTGIVTITEITQKTSALPPPPVKFSYRRPCCVLLSLATFWVVLLHCAPWGYLNKPQNFRKLDSYSLITVFITA